MLRVTWRKGVLPTRLLTESEMISELQTLAADNFSEAPAGPVTVECFDRWQRVLWRSDYAQASQMAALLRQLLYEQEHRAHAPSRHP